MDKQEANMRGNQNTITHTQTCRGISYMHLINKRYNEVKQNLKYGIDHLLPEILYSPGFYRECNKGVIKGLAKCFL